jgi:molybdopterin converting factor small subunit
MTVKAIWEALCSKTPDLRAHENSLLVAVNQAFASLDAKIAPGDEIAFMPPVQGG